MAIETQWVDVNLKKIPNTLRTRWVYTEYVSEIRTKFRTLIEG
jgi:hypothetical protein